MNEAVREMTFEEEYKILNEEKKELFDREIEGCEPPFANCVVRRALRCIRKLMNEKDKELEQYRSIGTIEECREAVERQRAKNPIDGKVRKVFGYYQCPTCGGLLTTNKRFCEDCRQAISWEESEGEDD